MAVWNEDRLEVLIQDRLVPLSLGYKCCQEVLRSEFWTESCFRVWSVWLTSDLHAAAPLPSVPNMAAPRVSVLFP